MHTCVLNICVLCFSIIFFLQNDLKSSPFSYGNSRILEHEVFCNDLKSMFANLLQDLADVSPIFWYIKDSSQYERSVREKEKESTNKRYNDIFEWEIERERERRCSQFGHVIQIITVQLCKYLIFRYIRCDYIILYCTVLLCLLVFRGVHNIFPDPYWSYVLLCMYIFLSHRLKTQKSVHIISQKFPQLGVRMKY